MCKELVSDPEHGNDWKNNLVAALDNMIKIGHWDGLDCAGTILHFLSSELKSMGFALEPPTTVHACDINKAARRVLTNLEPTRSTCVFGDMEERLPRKLRNMLDNLEPKPGTSNEDAIAAMQAMKQMVLDD